MPARRPPSRTFSAERLVEALTHNQAELYDRFERKIDDLLDRVESVKASLEQDLKLVQHDVRLEGHQRQLLATEISSFQYQLGELRDAVHMQKRLEGERAAQAAARVAAPAAANAAVSASRRKLVWPQWIAVFGVALMVLVTLAEKGPPTLRFMESTWKAWAGIKEK